MKKEDLLQGLTDAQREKAKNCQSREELLKMAQEEGVELNDEQLAAVSGGCTAVDKTSPSRPEHVTCTNCGSSTVELNYQVKTANGYYWEYKCRRCGTTFKVGQ